MKEYEYEGEAFQVDDSGCDGSSDWAVKVTDGKNTAVITWFSGYDVIEGFVYHVQVQENHWNTKLAHSPEEAYQQAAEMLIRQRQAPPPTTPEEACKALIEFID